MNNIKKEDLLKAIEEIDKNGIPPGRKSFKYDLLYDNKKYPPLLVVSYANKIVNGKEFPPNTLGGGPSSDAFKLLNKEGFEVILKNQDKYTWVETHYDLVNYLSQNQNNQLELIELLQSVGITEFTDKDITFQDIPLTEIDPFTFFCYLYKHGPERRLKILKDLAIKLEITEPSDELGIPSANAQKVWLFPYKANRNNNEIDRLWNFFFSEMDDTITDEQFADVLQIKNVGKVKITESLFYVNPEKYFPLNGPTKPYIEEVFGINSKFTSFSEYKAILEALRKKTDKPFYELSYEAWVWNDKKKKTNYWIFQGNSKIYDVVGALKSNAVTTWKIAAHNEKIKIDDKIILWLTGNNSGCYALAKVVSEVGKYEMTPEEIKFYKESYNDNEDRVLIEIEKNYCSNPILWNTIKDESILKDFNGGNQGTTFTATKAEYDFFFTNTTSSTQTNDIMDANSLNQILFGPPGTGKTFNTINEALKIVDPSYFEENQNDRKKLTERFKELLIKNSDENKGQIGFCTFHQSFSYEDFVEGIKPKTTDTKNVYYDIEPGIFKRICQLADSYNSTVKVKTQGILSWNEEQFNKASFYKLSLGEANNPDDREIYEYCRDYGYIAIGFGHENDFSGLSESEIKEKCEDLKLESIAGQQMYTFIHYLKKNNYVLVSNGNKYIRAIGKVTGDYEYKAESPIRYNHFRKVEWLFVDENIPVEEIYNIGLSQRTMYKIDESLLKRDFFTNNGQETLMPDLVKEEKNYVLIIDEINRGNVSSIFGELITLIEKDKRACCDEELEVTLPYSKEPFKVPSNVYLIGTMNTADRSIEALDTALRRRFSFKEFPPKPNLIKTEGASSKNNGKVDGIDLENLLNTINTRIEKLIDKDHKIGHSYFLKVNNKEKLVHAFKNEIIPLLEEYFFGDYGKIGLVLGSSFVEKVNHDFDFANFEHYDADIQSDLKEKAVFRIKNEDQWDFTTI